MGKLIFHAAEIMPKIARIVAQTETLSKVLENHEFE
jgi:hypothetical protein